MTTLVTFGDRLVSRQGRETAWKRPSVPLSWFAGGGTVTLDGRLASYHALYEEQPWVATAVNKISRQIVRLPLRVYQDIGDGEVEPVAADHPLAVLLGAPWPRAGQLALKQKLTHPTLVHGNGLLGKLRSSPGSPPSKLFPLDWRFLEPVIVGNELIAWRTSEYGDQVFLALEDVVHMRWEAGGQIGVSPLRQLGTTLRSEDAAQRYQASSFTNGARPSGGLVLPAEASLDKDERDELREEIKAMHSGPDSNASIMLLSGGLDWKPFSHTAVEAELIEQRKINREEIAAVYDIDPPMIAILDHATYSNVGEMHRMLYGPTLGPWLALIVDTIQQQLIAPEPQWHGLSVRFDLTEVLKANSAEEMNAITAGIAGGVLTPNEGRQRFGLRKSANAAADELYLPVNNLKPLGQPADPPTLRIQQEPPADQPAIEGASLDAHVERWAGLIRRKSLGGHPKPWDRERFLREGGSLAAPADLEAAADRLELLLVEQHANAGQ